MADPPTPLSLPSSLPYPLTVTRLLASPGTSISRGTALLEYTFTSATTARHLSLRAQGKATGLSAQEEQELREGDMVGTWESEVEGEVVGWEGWVQIGSKIDNRQVGKTALRVQQACTHPVQLHGMCGVCGKDLTADDYLSPPARSSAEAGPSRYPGGYEVSHDALGVTVSTNEAKRLDSQTKASLLSRRKLSLIVDLDQTIIHTTVDPTVGEWMREIAEDEGGEGGETTTPPGSPSAKGKGRERNPNADALRDVARFQLPDDLPPGYVPPRGAKRAHAPERWYYTKPRPGLTEFLASMAELYEMHVYTMGTRSYADAIVNVVDPDGTVFGGRILSRDESGSFSNKSLTRLFPTDQSMVVVIDDRADVWGDCPNLVKVVPYDFFLGIGDINSSFLPPTTPKPTSPPSSAPSPASTPGPATPPEAEDDTSLKEGLARQAKMLDEMSEKRPLRRLEEEMEKDEEEAVAVAGQEGMPGDGNGAEGKENGKEMERSSTPPGSPGKAQRKPLLNAHDDELQRVENILRKVHSSFYHAYDEQGDGSPNSPLPLACDVEIIVPELKSRVLRGCTILFSGLIPKHIPTHLSELWQAAEAFGAHPVLDVVPSLTHCVVAAPGTEKAQKAKRVKGCQVVYQAWFWRCVGLWKRVEEGEYLVEPPPLKPSSPKSVSATEAGQGGLNGERNPGVKSEAATGGSPGASDEKDVVAGAADPAEEAGGEGGGEEEAENGDGEEGSELDQVPDGAGWDDDADAEFEAFMEGSSDVDASERASTRDGSVAPGSPPGTPSKKRVRYADEESLPLEEFKDPSPLDRSESPPKKKRLLLLDGPGEGEQVPPENRFEWRGKDKRELEEAARQRELEKSEEEEAEGTEGVGSGGAEVGEEVTAGQEEQKEEDEEFQGEEQSEVGSEGVEEDEFAAMLMDSLNDDNA